MKIRIKFSKHGQMKFIGHLDIMRYFQKVMRRANVDICYSEGFSPHQKMSFAAPLGVGLTSNGEYFDIEVNSSDSSQEMIKRINDANVEGIQILSFNKLPEDAKNCMAIISGADYTALDINKYIPQEDIEHYMSREEIIVLKKTKKSEKEIDIKPMIKELYLSDRGLFMKVSQGSAANLKPDLVVESLFKYVGAELPKLISYCREEMYCTIENKFVSLDKIGGPIE